MDPNWNCQTSGNTLGATYTFDNDYVLLVDSYTLRRKTAVIYNLGLEQTGTAPDGRPIFSELSTDGRAKATISC